MEPSQDLFDKVMRRLATEEKKMAAKAARHFFCRSDGSIGLGRLAGLAKIERQLGRFRFLAVLVPVKV